METTAPVDPVVVVLAEGETMSAVNNARGHLFEQFVGRLLEVYGYEEPTSERRTVTANGIELDLRLRHRLTRQVAVVECKAYNSPIKASLVTAFYGRLTAERFEDPHTHGFMVVIPRLSPDAVEFSEKVSSRDAAFTVMNSRGIVEALEGRGEIPKLDAGSLLVSDPAVVVTEYGLFAAAKRIDHLTRTATHILVRGPGSRVPHPVIGLLEASDYADTLPVIDLTSGIEEPTATPPAEPDSVIVPVTGSKSDFEYQLPASPKFFVGRKNALAAIADVVGQGSGVVVLNAQSGWGKSSLALRMQDVTLARGGHSIVVDSRTASNRLFVSAVLRRAAVEAEAVGLLRLPTNSSWASTASSLNTLAQADWLRRDAPLMVFFDQFENIFRDEIMTREFRDLALGVREVVGPFLVGFAWKTDYVGWTEGHPYQLRDEIRGAGRVILLDPLGPREVETLLRRLEKELDQKLLRELRQRLREYSQGLPWLLKKLAGHVIREVQAGVTQERLVSEALNVQNLFEADLAELSPQEREALSFVARYAPIAVTEVMDRVSAPIVQSLLDRRLLVQVGERLDTYWDIFRDFLNTGRIPIEDSYILRMAPMSVARLLTEVVADHGDSSVFDVARRLETSENAIWNLARELRLMGVSTYEANRVRLIDEVWNAVDREYELRRRVASSLRRHRAYTMFQQLTERSAGAVEIASYARELPSAFPAVEVARATWGTYARVFLSWFEYAGLATITGSTAQLAPEGSAGVGNILAQRPVIRIKGAFPQAMPGPSIAVLRDLGRGIAVRMPDDRRGRSAIRELMALGAVDIDVDGLVHIKKSGLVKDGDVVPGVLRELLDAVPGGRDALELLAMDPGASPIQVGETIRAALNADWADGTRASSGKAFRGWARVAGVLTSLRRAAPSPADAVDGDPEQAALDLSVD